MDTATNQAPAEEQRDALDELKTDVKSPEDAAVYEQWSQEYKDRAHQSGKLVIDSATGAVMSEEEAKGVLKARELGTH